MEPKVSHKESPRTIMFQNPNNHKKHVQKRKGWETLINSLAECEKAAVWKGRMVMNKFYFCGTFFASTSADVSKQKKEKHNQKIFKLDFQTINTFDTFLKLLNKELKQF